MRSVTLRFLFNYKYGQDALAIGWEPNTEATRRMLFEWADLIVVAEESFRELVPDEYREKVVIYDLGPDVWGMSLHPTLVPRCDALIQRHLEASAKAIRERDAPIHPTSEPDALQRSGCGGTRHANPADCGVNRGFAN